MCFLCHFPSGHPALALPSTLPCRARTFLDPPGADRDRPAYSRTDYIIARRFQSPYRASFNKLRRPPLALAFTRLGTYLFWASRTRLLSGHSLS